MSNERPDPDALLRRVAAEESRASRGRLKIFFGASPGVGKTYAMLEAARAKKAEGTDVVIGWVETHGRKETAALAEGLERLPPAGGRVPGHAPARVRPRRRPRPQARRSSSSTSSPTPTRRAPGTRSGGRTRSSSSRRGSNVYTTLNVQHLESLNDLVNQVTGVAVRETVPDRLLDDAEEVEFVDLPAEDLLKRLAEGKVYVKDRAAQAVKSFFRRGNLLALRELALRRTAERVDADVRDYRRDHAIEETWPVAERILVCVRPNPDSDRLVRAARRMAARLRAEWIVVSVESPSQPPLSAVEREALAATTKLAEQLGATTAVLSGDSVSEALLSFARERNVSKIVVGKPAHGRWRDRLRGSLLDEIVRGSGEVDVYIISGERGGEPRPARPAAARRATRPVQYLWSGAVVLACTLLCWAMHGRFDRSNLIMVYLLGVALVASRHGRGPSAARGRR